MPRAEGPPPDAGARAPDPRDLVPRDKGDIERAEAAVRAGYPFVEPILGDLLEWLQDLNWPVAGVLVPFLESLGPVAPLLDRVRAVLAGDDDVWKYWVLGSVVGSWDAEGILRLRPELERMASQPTAGEIAEEVTERARELLATVGIGGEPPGPEQEARDLLTKAGALLQLDHPGTAIRVYAEVVERFGDAPGPELRRCVVAALEGTEEAHRRRDEIDEEIAATTRKLERRGALAEDPLL
jgi:hypothetical protein